MRRALVLALAVACSSAALAQQAEDDDALFRPRAVGGGPAIAFVNVSTITSNGGGATGACVTPNQSTTTGNHLVCFFRHEGTTTSVSSVTDDGGSTWSTPAAAYVNNADAVMAGMVYAENITGNATNNVTINLTATRAWFMCACAQYSGVPATSSLDTAWGASGIRTGTTATNTVSFTSGTTTGAGVVVCGVSNNNGSTVTTWNDSLTERLDGGGSGEIAMGERIVASSTAIAPSMVFSNTTAGAGVCMAFKD